MALGSRGIVERRDRGLRTRHRPEKPSTTEGQIEAMASTISDQTVADHVAAADPHTQYQKESERGAAGGYASLDGGGTVPDAQIPAAIARDAEVTAAIAAHEAAGDPHPGYRLESASIGTGDLANDAVTYAKMQNVSATDKLLGRSTAGAGDVEEIPCTAAGRDLLDDATAAAQLATLGAQAAAQAAWAAVPALQNSWVNFGGAYADAQFYKDTKGTVHLRGMIKNGATAAGTNLFTLAAGNRPDKNLIIACVSNGAFCLLLIDTGGSVNLEIAASATYVSLDGVHFRAA